MDAFPVDTDAEAESGGSMTPADSARHLRDQLISSLADCGDFHAVEALRNLEKLYGKKYPWLRRPRAARNEGIGTRLGLQFHRAPRPN